MSFWQQHQARLAAKQAQFGTVLGLHTVADLSDLLNAIDAKVAAAEKVTLDPGNQASFLAKDIDQSIKWNNDWSAFKARYLIARNAAVARINSFNLLPKNAAPAESEYQGVLNALGRSENSGSLDELIRRFHDQTSLPISLPVAPQPSTPDVDASLLRNQPIAAVARAGESAIRTGENVAHLPSDALALARHAEQTFSDQATRAKEALADAVRRQERDLKIGLAIAGGLMLVTFGMAAYAASKTTPEDRMAAYRAAKLLAL